MGPILLHDNTLLLVTQAVLQKLNNLAYKVLPHLPCSPDLSPTNYHFFKHLDSFLQGKHFHNQQEAENAFQESVKSQSMDFYAISSVQFSSVTQSCPTLCNPMNRSMPSLPVHHQLPEFIQIRVSSHLILSGPLLLLPPIPPSVKVFSSESTLRMR